MREERKKYNDSIIEKVYENICDLIKIANKDGKNNIEIWLEVLFMSNKNKENKNNNNNNNNNNQNNNNNEKQNNNNCR